MKLIMENWRSFLNELSLGEPTKNIEYTAFVLADNSKLLGYVPEGWTTKAHHMTILPPTDMKRRLPSRWLDYSGCLEVVGIAQNEQVIAVRVDLGDLQLPMKIRGFPHITIAVNPKSKPPGEAQMSNDFVDTDFEPLEGGPIEVCGSVEEVPR